jgi:uncharacterized repeat protein (TIGR01451 family)
MKLNKNIMALATAAAFGISGQAFAAGTASGTTIENTMSISYTVDSQTQTPVSNTESFVVDTKVDFTLTLQSSDTQDVTPGKSYFATYLLTNTGNATLDFNLAAADLGIGSHIVGLPSAALTEIDNTDLSAIDVRIENDGEYDSTVAAPTSTFIEATDSSATGITDLQADYAHLIYVYVTVDSDSKDADIAVTDLSATAADGTTLLTDSKGTANTQSGTPQVVFADSLFNGVETINTGFEVVSARFTHDVSGSDIPGPGLTFKVINDTICDDTLTADTTKVDYSSAGCTITGDSGAVTYFPKAIPGAMIEYTIVAENTGGEKATGVTFTQDLLSAHVDAIDLQAASLRNATAVFTADPVGTLPDNTDSATLTTNSELNVTVDNFEKDDLITITFTAIVE